MAGTVIESGKMAWTRQQWLALRAAHEARVVPWVDEHLARRHRGRKHPVHDFLFDYYPFPPAKLRSWMPPLGVVLKVEPGDEAMWPESQSRHLLVKGDQVKLGTHGVSKSVARQAQWVAVLCRTMGERPARFGCHGLHEWAMVYRQTPDQVRHNRHPLRMPPEELAAFVESRPICCTHFDAFRFFTQEARPLNAVQPELMSRLELEQGGCLHANMDLYKWAFKLWPWSGSDLVGRAFELAMEGREIDMRASPYDLAALGYEPIRIETAEGRDEYEQLQRGVAARGALLRKEIGRAAEQLLNSVEPELLEISPQDLGVRLGQSS